MFELRILGLGLEAQPPFQNFCMPPGVSLGGFLQRSSLLDAEGPRRALHLDAYLTCSLQAYNSLARFSSYPS